MEHNELWAYSNIRCLAVVKWLEDEDSLSRLGEDERIWSQSLTVTTVTRPMALLFGKKWLEDVNWSANSCFRAIHAHLETVGSGLVCSYPTSRLLSKLRC